MHRLAKAGFAAAILAVFVAGPQTARAGDVASDAAPLCPVAGQRLSVDRFVPIGGIEQWVTISGDRCDNPVILFIHGGPGNPLSPFADNLYADWEKDFTLVQWDQRGAGLTFGANPEPAGLTIAGMTQDGVEVAAWLTEQLGQKKVILMGGSWGSVLAVHMAVARPDLFHAYLGTGQLVSYRDNAEASYRRTLALANEAGDTAAVATLESLGPPPWSNPRSFGALRRVTRAYEARTATPPPADWWSPGPDYATEAAGAAYEGGEEFSYIQFVGLAGNGLYSTVDLPALGTDFPIPVFLVQGSEDLVTVPDVAKAYFDSLSAPQKAYRVAPLTGHDPNEAMVAAQLDILQSLICPLTQ